MGYVVSHLSPDEDVVYEARVHWFIFVRGIIWAAIGIFIWSLPSYGNPSVQMFYAIAGTVILLTGFYKLFNGLVYTASTELAVTTKRVIVKAGLSGKNAIDLDHGDIKDIQVTQEFSGRMFNYGTVAIVGTGGKIPIKRISRPLEFRRHAMKFVGGAAATHPAAASAISATSA